MTQLKKELVPVVVVAILIVAGVPLLTVNGFAYAGTSAEAVPGNTWHVDDDLIDYPAANFSVILDAVVAASNGDAIVVHNGTYEENVLVNKSLTIESANGTENTSIQAANPDKHVFEVIVNHVNISGFTVKGAANFARAGIYISREHCNISNNNCTNNDRGLYLSCARNNTITKNNCVQNSGYGIYIKWGGNNSILSNNCTKNEYGIYTEESKGNFITCNYCALNAEDGISLAYSSNGNRISDNICSLNSRYGIYPFMSDRNIITCNNCSSNTDYGICLSNSDYNTILNNNCISNDYYGICPYKSNNNVIYLNNFRDNPENAYSLESTNIWNSTVKMGYTYNGTLYENYIGNYWHDYTGTDADKDGLRDKPYCIDTDYDFYPLVNPFEGYNAPAALPVHNQNLSRNYTSIQVAIDDPDTKDGDTITVDPGLYNVTVNVTKSLTIRSTTGNTTDTIVKAANYNCPVFNVTADYVNINGFTVKGANKHQAIGIQLRNTSYCTISGNNVLNTTFGIILNSSCYNRIEHISNGSINLLGSCNNTVTDNNVSSIQISCSYNNTLRNNEMHSFGVDIQDNTNIAECINFVDTSNKLKGKPVYYWIDEKDKEVPGDTGYVALVNCTNVTVKDVALAGNVHGIVLAYTKDSEIENVTTSKNSDFGIGLFYSSNNTIFNCNTTTECSGICLRNSTYNTVANSTASNNDFGISFCYSANNTVINNTFNANNMSGINLRFLSNGNMIYHNDFVNNTDSVYSENSVNIWNSSEAVTYIYNGSIYTSYFGNYWDDYNGTDTNMDGIGDTPYRIGSDEDSYPLMIESDKYCYIQTGKSFDTGPCLYPYPSISGTHNGTITLNQTITVQTLYTYPCAGTGGHTEYARIWNSVLDVNATWDGYEEGGWHNVSFNDPFMLGANETYNYTIRTGSYPQVHHRDALQTANGWINSTGFIDINGHVYQGRIPAIRLFF